MEQKMSNINYQRDVHKRSGKTYGVITSIQIEEVLPSGRTQPYRCYCSYAFERAKGTWMPVNSILVVFGRMFSMRGGLRNGYPRILAASWA